MTIPPSDDDLTRKYPSNSYKEREKEAAQPAKKVEKVISGKAVKRKIPLSRKIAETLTGDDAQTVGGYILFEVVIPAFKTLLSDVATQGVERLLFGDARPRQSSYGRQSGGIRTNYDRMYQPAYRREEPRRPAHSPQRSRSSQEQGEIVVRTRNEAQDVLDALVMLLEQYDVVTVADMYETVGITGSFTDSQWGWTDLRDARIHRIREGYLVAMPRPQPID